MIKFFRKRLNKKGFTLVELLIVIAVLGIIAGIAVPSMSGVTSQIKLKADKESAKIARAQIEVYTMLGTWSDETAVTYTGGAQTVTDAQYDVNNGLPTSQVEDGDMVIVITPGATPTANFTISIKTKTGGTELLSGDDLTIKGLIK